MLVAGPCTVVASTGAVGGGEDGGDVTTAVVGGIVVGGAVVGTVVVVGRIVVATVVGDGQRSVGIVVVTVWLVTNWSSNVAVAVSETVCPATSLVSAVTVSAVNELDVTARLKATETM